MRLELFGQRLLILCDAVEERKVGSIFMPDKHSERSRMATIVAVGNDVTHYIPGDRVMISWYTGVHLHIIGETLFGQEVDEDRHRLVMENEILGKVMPD